MEHQLELVGKIQKGRFMYTLPSALKFFEDGSIYLDKDFPVTNSPYGAMNLRVIRVGNCVFIAEGDLELNNALNPITKLPVILKGENVRVRSY